MRQLIYANTQKKQIAFTTAWSAWTTNLRIPHLDQMALHWQGTW